MMKNVKIAISNVLVISKVNLLVFAFSMYILNYVK